jgi:hypothetical protein
MEYGIFFMCNFACVLLSDIFQLIYIHIWEARFNEHHFEIFSLLKIWSVVMAVMNWILPERNPAVDFIVTVMNFGIHTIIDYVYLPFSQLHVTREGN